MRLNIYSTRSKTLLRDKSIWFQDLHNLDPLLVIKKKKYASAIRNEFVKLPGTLKKGNRITYRGTHKAKISELDAHLTSIPLKDLKPGNFCDRHHYSNYKNLFQIANLLTNEILWKEESIELHKAIKDIHFLSYELFLEDQNDRTKKIFLFFDQIALTSKSLVNRVCDDFQRISPKSEVINAFSSVPSIPDLPSFKKNLNEKMVQTYFMNLYNFAKILWEFFGKSTIKNDNSLARVMVKRITEKMNMGGFSEKANKYFRKSLKSGRDRTPFQSADSFLFETIDNLIWENAEIQYTDFLTYWQLSGRIKDLRAVIYDLYQISSELVENFRLYDRLNIIGYPDFFSNLLKFKMETKDSIRQALLFHDVDVLKAKPGRLAKVRLYTQGNLGIIIKDVIISNCSSSQQTYERQIWTGSAPEARILGMSLAHSCIKKIIFESDFSNLARKGSISLKILKESYKVTYTSKGKIKFRIYWSPNVSYLLNELIKVPAIMNVERIYDQLSGKPQKKISWWKPEFIYVSHDGRSVFVEILGGELAMFFKSYGVDKLEIGSHALIAGIPYIGLIDSNTDVSLQWYTHHQKLLKMKKMPLFPILFDFMFDQFQTILDKCHEYNIIKFDDFTSPVINLQSLTLRKKLQLIAVSGNRTIIYMDKEGKEKTEKLFQFFNFNSMKEVVLLMQQFGINIAADFNRKDLWEMTKIFKISLNGAFDLFFTGYEASNKPKIEISTGGSLHSNNVFHFSQISPKINLLYHSS